MKKCKKCSAKELVGVGSAGADAEKKFKAIEKTTAKYLSEIKKVAGNSKVIVIVETLCMDRPAIGIKIDESITVDDGRRILATAYGLLKGV